MPLARKSSARSTCLDVDWLVTRHLLKSLRHASEKYARGVLLDVGCGGQPYRALFQPHVERYVGVDTPASVRSRVDAAAVASQLPFADATFDTILCTEVLEHLSDPSAGVSEMARTLRRGGYLILTTPQMWHLHEAPYDFFRYTRYGLTHLCRRAALDVVEIRPHGGAWAAIGIMLIVHAGSCARALWQKVSRCFPPGARPAATQSNDWQAWFWPFRLPIMLLNLLCGALDSVPHPGIFAVDNMVIARKPL